MLYFVPRYSLGREALEIADRCGYRLVQADCHNSLDQLALEEGNRQKAQEHAGAARERVWCDAEHDSSKALHRGSRDGGRHSV